MAEGLSKYLLGVIAADAPRRGVVPSLLRGFLGGCAGLYDAGLEAYLASEQLGIRRRDRLPVPVVSIGNLTVGGAGKTPMTAALCRRLQARGLRPAILSRGHGGASHETRAVSDPNGRLLLSASDAGDEPVVLAKLCPGIPVIVGKDRRLSGREALRRWPVDVFVLDDGFQFWQLVRDPDIVLIDSRLPFDNGYPLPRGLLREPARHLARAGIAIVTRADRLDAAGRNVLMSHIRAYAPAIPVYFASHVATGLVPVPPRTAAPSPEVAGSSLGREQTNTTEEEGITVRDHVLPLKSLDGVGVVALCAIAQPDSFFSTLASSTGCRILREIRFDDHHTFDSADLDRIGRAVADSSASAVVMTEKDAVKWSGWERDGVAAYALRITVAIEDEDRFIEDVVARAGLKRS